MSKSIIFLGASGAVGSITLENTVLFDLAKRNLKGKLSDL
tara:strand:- start:1325 stop:1444 length:120 start_codon:yes stop_codon:yes gene_type:complete